MRYVRNPIQHALSIYTLYKTIKLLAIGAKICKVELVCTWSSFVWFLLHEQQKLKNRKILRNFCYIFNEFLVFKNSCHIQANQLRIRLKNHHWTATWLLIFIYNRFAPLSSFIRYRFYNTPFCSASQQSKRLMLGKLMVQLQLSLWVVVTIINGIIIARCA